MKYKEALSVVNLGGAISHSGWNGTGICVFLSRDGKLVRDKLSSKDSDTLVEWEPTETYQEDDGWIVVTNKVRE